MQRTFVKMHFELNANENTKSDSDYQLTAAPVERKKEALNFKDRNAFCKD